MRTGLEAVKVGIAGFVLPFMIIWSPAFLGDYSNPVLSIVGLFVCALIFIGLQAGFVGYLLSHLSLLERVLFFASAGLLLCQIYTTKMSWLAGGVVLFALGFAYQVMKKKRKPATAGYDSEEAY